MTRNTPSYVLIILVICVLTLGGIAVAKKGTRLVELSSEKETFCRATFSRAIVLNPQTEHEQYLLHYCFKIWYQVEE